MLDPQSFARLPLSHLWGSAYQVTVATPIPKLPRFVLAGDLAPAHPTLHTFRVPELAECLQRVGPQSRLSFDEAGMLTVLAASLAFEGHIEVAPATVVHLLEIHPALSEEEVAARWRRWQRTARSAYVKLRKAALHWMGEPTDLHSRTLANSWAADRVDVLW